MPNQEPAANQVQGYTGWCKLDGSTLNVKSLKVDGEIEPLCTSGTANTVKDNGVMEDTYVTNAATKRVEFTGDYNAGSDGDPPDYEEGDEVEHADLQAGYRYTGKLLITRFSSSFDSVKALIAYSIAAVFTGQVTRTAT